MIFAPGFNEGSTMTTSPRSTAPLAVALLLVACQGNSITFKNVAVASWDIRPPIEINGYLSKPEGKGPFPAVALLHGCNGLQHNVSQDWPAYLNGLGYVALAVDSFGSRGLGRCPNGIERNDLPMMKDAYGALKYLASQSYVKKDRIAVMGFSKGGVAINVIADVKPRGELEFAAGIGLYAHCKGLGDGRKPLFPLMQVVGDKDTRVFESCRTVENESVEVHVLPGAYHAFDAFPGRGFRYNHRGDTALYDGEATAKAEALTKAFFAKHLGE